MLSFGTVAALLVGAVAGQHLQLPGLTYGYGDLEPYFDETTMTVHHLGHHQAYTDKTNQALAKLRANMTTHDLAKMGLDSILKHLADVPDPERTILRNQGGGYVNHELWFSQLAPPIEKGGSGGIFDHNTELGKALVKQFINFDIFKELFKNAALKVFGSGWAWLELDMRGGVPVLAITTTTNQDSPAMEQGRVPLLGLDVWEHAYCESAS